jgi:hypothetical protein
MQAGYADIDYNYEVYAHNGNSDIWGFALNGDQYGIGRRPLSAQQSTLPLISACLVITAMSSDTSMLETASCGTRPHSTAALRKISKPF